MKPIDSSTNNTGKTVRWITDQLQALAISKGMTYEPQRLKINAEDLLDIPQERLAMLFAKARRELDYLPQVPELRRLAHVDESGNVDADMRAAWDLLIKHVAKWGRWNCERDHAYLETGAPVLPQRIADSVRRTGGWTLYLAMDADSFPFQQKRFFEEYKAWTRTERAAVDLARLLPAADVKQLVAAKIMQAAPPATVDTKGEPKRIVPELTAEDLRVRRDAAKAYLAEYARKRAAISASVLRDPDAPA